MDVVFNHCGSSHWWMNDLPSKDWINNDGVFLQTNHATVTAMDVHASSTEKNTFLNGWFTRGMPDLNQRSHHLATYLIQNSIWWIEYARIDGIRQDTYSYLDYDFWPAGAKKSIMNTLISILLAKHGTIKVQHLPGGSKNHG